MKAKQVFDKLTENWLPKALCFIIAVFLYVIYQNQSVDTRVFSVPLGLEAKNGFVSVEPHPRTVVVSARGKSEELAQVRESDLKAYLDLNYVAKDGSYDFPVLLTLSDSASVLNPLELKVTPERVRLRVEEEVTAYVDINPLTTGKPAYGYGIKDVTVVPDQIAITGPKTMVENCKSLNTLGVHEDLSVSVTVELEEMDGSKQFTKLPVKVLNLSQDLEVRAVTNDVTVTLRGSLVSLDSFKPDENFVTADASNIEEPGTFYVPLSFSVPKKFALADGYTKSVPITFTTKQTASQTDAVEEKITVVETDTGMLEEKVEQKKAR